MSTHHEIPLGLKLESRIEDIFENPYTLIPAAWEERESLRSDVQRVFTPKRGRPRSIVLRREANDTNVGIRDNVAGQQITVGHSTENGLYVAEERIVKGPEIAGIIYFVRSWFAFYQNVPPPAELIKCGFLDGVLRKGETHPSLNVGAVVTMERLDENRRISREIRSNLGAFRYCDRLNLELRGKRLDENLISSVEIHEEAPGISVQKVDFTPLPVSMTLEKAMKLITAAVAAVKK